MKRITNYALNCLIEQGILKEHIKSLIKAIENQTRDNILTPEQAIEILLDGVIYKEELHQQTVLDSNAYNSGRTVVWENTIYTSVYLYGQVLLKRIYIILCRIPVDSQIFLCKVSMLIYVEKILTVYLH